MKQLLENSLYDSRPVEEVRAYQVGDLSSLSAVALFYGNGIKISTPKAGMTLAGGLKIKKVGKNTLTLNQDTGLLRDLYTLHPDGGGALRNIALTKGKSTLMNKKSW